MIYIFLIKDTENTKFYYVVNYNTKEFKNQEENEKGEKIFGK